MNKPVRYVVPKGRTPNYMDKLKAHYIEGKKLSVAMEERKSQLEKTNALRVQGFSREQTVNMLVQMGVTGSVSNAYLIVRHAEELFGDIHKANKEGLRHILTENFYYVFQKAKAKGDLREMNKALENIAEINNLSDPAPNGIDYSKLLIPVPVYTTNTEALKQPPTEDATTYTIEG